MPQSEQRKELLQAPKTIAIVGAKDTPDTPVNTVGRYLMNAGFTVIPVHPVRKEVWGCTAYPTLADVPVNIDIVDIFRASEFCADHAKETAALAHKPQAFWMQLGVSSPEARRIAEDVGINVVENRCIKIEHACLQG